MEIILYTLLFFLATVIGAATGTGGGAVIKPLLDFAGMDSAATIGVYSAIAVFTMCISSIIKSLRNGLDFRWNLIISLSLGSITGGILGDYIFKLATTVISNDSIIIIQSIGLFLVLVTLMVFTQFNDQIATLKIRNLAILFIMGCLVGAISVFLGIGGGPLNIITLVGLMSFTPKGSVAYSLSMIFFSQIPKIINILFNSSDYQFRPILIPLIILASILGGIVGTWLYQKQTEKQVRQLYLIMIIFLLVACVTNIVRSL